MINKLCACGNELRESGTDKQLVQKLIMKAVDHDEIQATWVDGKMYPVLAELGIHAKAYLGEVFCQNVRKHYLNEEEMCTKCLIRFKKLVLPNGELIGHETDMSREEFDKAVELAVTEFTVQRLNNFKGK